MSEIRALIVDDEPLARRGIRQLLAPHPDVVVVGECRDGREAVRALATVKPDLVFLDVQMPGLDGLGVIRVHGAERMPATVFITAHDQFAVEAFEAQALDYLVKPLSETRFREALHRVRERIRMHDAVSLAAKLSALLRGEAVVTNGTGRAPKAPIAVPTDAGELLLDQGEIDWIEAADDYAVIHAGGKSHRVRAALSTLESRLDPARFTRIHRSSVVRLDRVREWKSDLDDEMLLVLRDGTELPVSRRRAAQVKALLRPSGRPGRPPAGNPRPLTDGGRPPA
ncbi:MAG TPA: LytTR family DNA-binding domain-containing protein [Gemmatimonadales bacterium]|jgi:two-component system LytT family response regulator|nr:LytTR family DNA-binding domain-containing protein [Gemmatimonadales bacterium]